RNSAQHDDESLPSWFRSELPGLRRQSHLLLVHTFIDHARNLHVTSQRKPPDTVNRFSYFLFEKRKLDVEEKIEFLNTCLENLGGNEMPKFMQHNQKRKAKQELRKLNNNVHSNLFCAQK